MLGLRRSCLTDRLGGAPPRHSPSRVCGLVRVRVFAVRHPDASGAAAAPVGSMLQPLHRPWSPRGAVVEIGVPSDGRGLPPELAMTRCHAEALSWDAEEGNHGRSLALCAYAYSRSPLSRKRPHARAQRVTFSHVVMRPRLQSRPSLRIPPAVTLRSTSVPSTSTVPSL